MPSKKKKYNSRFPPARIKKIMQTDDEVGKVAAAVPVLISKCLEMFLVSILQHTGEVTKEKRAKTMSTSHLKECIMTVKMFDFLKDVVANVPDMQNEEEPSTSSTNSEQKKTVRKRNMNLPKTPKKRAKLGKSNAEENEESDGESEEEVSQGSSNGALSSSMSSTGHQSPPNVSDQKSSTVPHADETVQKSTSFHIPLDDLLSPDKEKLIRNREADIEHNAAPAVADRDISTSNNNIPYAKQGNAHVELHKNNDSAIDMSISKVPVPNAPTRCGVIVTNSSISTTHKNIVQQTTAVQPRFDRHNNNTHREAVASQRPDIKVHIPPPSAAISQSHFGKPRMIPSPLHMPHLYSPLPPIPNLPNPRMEGSKKMPAAPAGSMLNFLYSPYQNEEASNFALPPARFSHPDAQPSPRISSKESTKLENIPVPPYPNIRLLYPYNPVDEHYKRMALAAPHNPYPGMVNHHPDELVPGTDGAPHTLPPPPPVAKKLVDDDDYDA